MRKSNWIVAVIGSLLLFSEAPVYAITIDIIPETYEVTVGTPVNVDIAISGLGDISSPSVGTFDIDIAFDPGVLSFDSVTFGDQLDLFGLGDIRSVDTGISGMVSLFELSLDSASDLDAFQMSAFTLATLTFDSHTIGTSAISLALNALGDSNGDLLMATMQDGSINVIAAPTGVPEPATWLLVGLGLLGMFIMNSKSTTT
jgi:hypothetical protein